MTDSLADSRKKIDQIDEELLVLLNERAGISQKIGQIKRSLKRDVFVPGREFEIYKRLNGLNKGPLPEGALRAIFGEVISASQSLQKPIIVAYLGPKGTFSHLACSERFGLSVDDQPKDSIEAVFEAVEKGLADFGIVPVENSTAGVVNDTLDLLVDSNLHIFGESYLQVRHHLLSKAQRMEDIETIYSHPQPIAQCRTFLTTYLPQVPTVAVSSTTHAAELCQQEPRAAAIASSVAASLYGLTVLKASIEDSTENSTRFLIVSKKRNVPTGNDKTSIIVSTKDQPGALYNTLRIFSEQKINLTMIKSRPSKKKAWEYLFHIDFEGHVEDESSKMAFRLLKKETIAVKVLGAYPSAEVVAS